MSLASNLVRTATEEGITLCLAESVTGGLVSSAITDVEGASKVLYGSWVCYTDSYKSDIIGVNKALIERDSAVSPSVAKSLALNIKNLCDADIALAIVGYAGPCAESVHVKPDIGRVYFGLHYKDVLMVKFSDFKGNRLEIRKQATDEALSLLLRIVELVR